jgi:hypothetical protein
MRVDSEFRVSHLQSVSNPVFDPPRVSGGLNPGLGKVSRPTDRNRESGPLDPVLSENACFQRLV